MEQLSPYTTTTETALQSLCSTREVTAMRSLYTAKKKVDPLAPKKKRKAHAQ